MNVKKNRRESRLLPDGWKWVKLGEVCIQQREILEARSPRANGLPYLSLEDIASQSGKILLEPPFSLRSQGISTSFVFDQRHVLYGKLRPYLNKVALPDFAGRCTTEIIPLRPNEHIDRTYVAWILRRDETVEAAMREKTGSRMPRANMAELFKLPIPLPPVPEQKRIVAILNEKMAAIEKARAAAEAQLKAAEALRHAYYRRAFGTITPLSTQSGASSDSRGWRWRLLKDVARLESGHTPSRYHPEWWGGEIPWLALPDIRRLDGRYAYETTEYTNKDGIANSSARILPAGTVCLSRTASVGFVAMMGRPMATSQDFVNWVCGPELDPAFLMHLFLYSREYFVSLASGAIHKTVYMPTVDQLRVLIPEVAKQKQIATRLFEQITYTERLRTDLEIQIVEINALPAALLRRAFRGEI